MGFIFSFLKILLAIFVFRILAIVLAGIVALFILSQAFAQSPGEYTYQTVLEFENVSGATTTMLLPIQVNAQNYVSNNLIGANGNDALFTDESQVVIPGFTQDMTGNGVNWWSFVTTLPTASTTDNFVFTLGPDADDGFPIVNENNSWVHATSSASIEISDDLDVRIEIESPESLCGVIISKLDSPQNKDGWGMFSTGNLDSVSSPGAGSIPPVNGVYIEFIPLIDLWLCGASIGESDSGGPFTITFTDVVNVTTGQTLANFGSEIPIYHPRQTTGLMNNFPNQMVLFPEPVPVDAGDQYRVRFNSNIDMLISDNSFVATGTVAAFSSSCVVVGGFHCHRRTASSLRPAILYVDRSVSTSTSIIHAVVNDTISEGTWDGQRATWQLTYSDPTLTLLKDTIVQDTDAVGGAIATSSENIIMGRGINGAIHNLEIDAGVPTVVDLDFDGNDITETIEGTAANSWEWLGAIDDESASTNDFEYHITANTTNINRSVTGFSEQPTPTPLPTTFTPAGIVGNPSFDPFFTPVPTPATGIIMNPLREVAGSSAIPSDIWWMLVATPILAFMVGKIYQFAPMPAISAAISIIGFSIVALAVGEQFGIWIVALHSLWSVGATVLVQLWTR